jgi:hypothetical protein
MVPSYTSAYHRPHFEYCAFYHKKGSKESSPLFAAASITSLTDTELFYAAAPLILLVILYNLNYHFSD